jgi:flagellar secretion chaperone FliS
VLLSTPKGAAAYRRIEAESRSPLELVVMLYDGALRFVSEAKQAHLRGDILARGNAISRCLAIIAELQSTLNVEQGGAVAEELDRLYTYINTRLVDVSAKQDVAALDEVHRLLTPVRDAWADIATGGGKPVQP